MTGTRHRDYAQGDDLPLIDGDAAFRGVDERTNPAQLAEGFLASGKNIRLRNGVVETRGGDVFLGAMKTDGYTPFTECYGCEVISDPAGEEWLLVAADGALWKCRPNMAAKQILSDFGYLLDENLDVIVDENNVPIELSDGAAGVQPFFQAIQCFNRTVILRGEDFPPMIMRHLDTGFEVVEPSNNGTGTLGIPNSAFGLFHGNRLFLQHTRDQVVASDVQDETRYSEFNDFRINVGDNDRLVAMAAFGDADASLLMLKDQSVWRVNNVTGDLSNITLRNITRKYGCVAPFSVVDFGSDIAWLSDRGIVTLGLTAQNESQGTSLALSDPMVASMNRLRWDKADQVVAEYWDNKLYFAMPFDEALLVSDTDLASGGTYSLIGSKYYHVIEGLEIGAEYQYVPTTSVDVELIEAEITGGNPETEAMNRYQGSVVFTATTTTVSLEGTSATAVTATLKKVVKSGINNAVMVYDTVLGQWVGVDERAGLNVQRWFKITFEGRKRLGYVSANGEIRLYDEAGAEDEVISSVNSAYVDLVVLDQPKSGETLQIGGGTVVYPDPTRSSNAFSTFHYWGVQEAPDMDAVGANLWADSTYGYDPDNANTWSVGGHTVQQIDRGIRVTSSNATAPTLATYDHEAGAVQNITTSKRCGRTPGDNPCFYVDVMEGNMIQSQAIAPECLTRGYHGRQPWRKKFSNARVLLDSWDATYTVTLETPGSSETESVVSARTVSRSTTLGGDTWDTTNANDDHAARDREDYSVVLDNGQVGVTLGDNGVQLDAMQTFEEHQSVRGAEDWYAQLRVTSSTGRLTLKSAQVNAREGERSHGRRT